MIISVAKGVVPRKDKQKSNTCQKCIESSEKSNIQNRKWQQESFIQQKKLYILGYLNTVGKKGV